MFICNVYTHINIHTSTYIHIYIHVYLPYWWVLDCWPTCATTHLFRSHLSIQHDSFKCAAHELAFFYFSFSLLFPNLRNNPIVLMPPVHKTRLIQTCGTRTHMFFTIRQLPHEPIFPGPTYLTCQHDMTSSNMRHTNSYVLDYSSTTTRAHLFAVSLDSNVNATWIIQMCDTRTQISSIIHQLPREPIFCSLTWLKCQCDITHSNVRHTNSYFLHSFMSPSISVPSVNTTRIIQTCGNFAYCVSILNQLLYTHWHPYAKYALILFPFFINSLWSTSMCTHFFSCHLTLQSGEDP